MRKTIAVFFAVYFLCSAVMAVAQSTPEHNTGLNPDAVLNRNETSPGTSGDAAASTGKLGQDFFEEAKSAAPLVNTQVYESAGYLGDIPKDAKTVTDGGNIGQYIYGTNETVFINASEKDGAKPGDRYYVLSVLPNEIRHPVTKEVIGKKVFIIGKLEITGFDQDVATAKIISANDNIEKGNRLIPYKDMAPPVIDPDKPVESKNINGYVVASRDAKQGYADGDVLYLDVGKANGVEPGDMFDVIASSSAYKEDKETHTKILGRIRILSTQDKTSTAIVTSSVNAISVGDKIKFALSR